MRELCWLITNNCNEKCKFCHFFQNVYKENNYEDNEKILYNLAKVGCSHITWSGGEAFLRDDIERLIRIAKNNNIKNTVITNGQSYSVVNPDVFKHLEELAISMDAIDSQTNALLGRNSNHYENVQATVDTARMVNPYIKIRINTVITSVNSDKIVAIGHFLEQNNITTWRISKFQSLRCNALKNKQLFEISDDKYRIILDNIIEKKFKCKIETRNNNDFEEKYIMIVPNGDIIVTEHGKDRTLGNALIDESILKQMISNI